jgi:hypothetical protein
MTKYLGLRGYRLKVAMVALVVLPSFMLFGWNNGSTGHATNLASFVKVSRFWKNLLKPDLNECQQFPQIDTVNTKGSRKSYNALILGKALKVPILQFFPNTADNG